MALTELASAFLSRNPTLIGIVAGIRFYEHPTYGDESPLVAILPDGRKKLSPYWECPDACELEGWER